MREGEKRDKGEGEKGWKGSSCGMKTAKHANLTTLLILGASIPTPPQSLTSFLYNSYSSGT